MNYLIKSLISIILTLLCIVNSANAARDNDSYEGNIFGGEVGIILDGRGREISFHSSETDRIDQILTWSENTNEYNKVEVNV